jgi:hypothetical protein
MIHKIRGKALGDSNDSKENYPKESKYQTCGEWSAL